MEIGFEKINVDPIEPAIKFGPGKKHLLTVKDELVCRIMAFKQEGSKPYYHISCPFGDLELSVTKHIKEELERTVAEKIDLTLASTHTHYSVNVNEDHTYERYLIERLQKAVSEMEFKEYKNVTGAFNYRFFNEVGTSRISGQETDNLFLETYSLRSDGKRIATWICYNSHPTTLNFHTNFFSSVGPGIMLRNLEKKYEGEFFTYMIGAAGDVSTRFTRTGQEYEDVLEMTKKVENAVEKLLESSVIDVPVKKYQIENKWLPVHREMRQWKEEEIPENLTPRERETLDEAMNKKHDMNALPQKVFFQKLTLGDHTFIFSPFELFSEYITYTDKEHCTIANCCNDHDSYLSGIKPQRMTFEIIGESIPVNSKENIIELLECWGN